MTKATQTLTYFIAFTSIWTILTLNILPLPLPLPLQQIIPLVRPSLFFILSFPK